MTLSTVLSQTNGSTNLLVFSDRTSPLEQRSDTLGRCIRLMSAVYYNELKDAIGELLYTACESDGKFGHFASMNYPDNPENSQHPLWSGRIR